MMNHRKGSAEVRLLGHDGPLWRRVSGRQKIMDVLSKGYCAGGLMGPGLPAVPLNGLRFYNTARPQWSAGSEAEAESGPLLGGRSEK